jgi:Mrp family chromosome partitioning ATPase
MIPPNPSELLGSREMKELLVGLEEAFDTVIIDAPPLLPVTDAAVLSQHVGGVVLVVGSHKLKQHDLEKSLSALELVGSTVLGVVLNQLPVKGPDAYSYSYYSTDAPPKSAPTGDPRTKKSSRVRVSRELLPSKADEQELFPMQPAKHFPADQLTNRP